MKAMTHRDTLLRRYTVRGMTLIELVIAIAVVGIAVSSVLGAMSAQATRSADAMIRKQASAIASAYLNEILQKNFSGPNHSTRATFDNINDYNSPPDAVRDQMGSTVAGLDQFSVAVTVGNGFLNGISASTQVQRVDVTVSHSSGTVVLLSGYRTKYP